MLTLIKHNSIGPKSDPKQSDKKQVTIFITSLDQNGGISNSQIEKGHDFHHLTSNLIRMEESQTVR
jgi:hypothetical protein